MVLDYEYLREAGLDHQQALYKLQLYNLLDEYKRERRGSNRCDILERITKAIDLLHDEVKKYLDSYRSIENVS